VGYVKITIPNWPPVVALIEWKLPGDGGASQQSYAGMLEQPSLKPLHDPLVKYLIVNWPATSLAAAAANAMHRLNIMAVAAGEGREWKLPL
jgi:hypothetical protein